MVKASFNGVIYGHAFDEENGWRKNVGWLSVNTTENRSENGIPLLQVVANGKIIGEFPFDQLRQLVTMAAKVAESGL